MRSKKTSTGLYRSCAALASLSSTFGLILFEAVNFEFWKVWFGLDKQTKYCLSVAFVDKQKKTKNRSTEFLRN